MSEALERSVLENKDRDQLVTIASALGVKTPARAKKSDIIDKILETTGVTSASTAPVEPAARVARAKPPKANAKVTEPALETPTAVPDPDSSELVRGNNGQSLTEAQDATAPAPVSASPVAPWPDRNLSENRNGRPNGIPERSPRPVTSQPSGGNSSFARHASETNASETNASETNGSETNASGNGFVERAPFNDRPGQAGDAGESEGRRKRRRNRNRNRGEGDDAPEMPGAPAAYEMQPGFGDPVEVDAMHATRRPQHWTVIHLRAIARRWFSSLMVAPGLVQFSGSSHAAESDTCHSQSQE